MFTGIIEEVGNIKNIKVKHGGLSIEVNAQKVIQDSKVGDSIAVNGVCLTITDIKENSFSFDVSQETLNRSNIGLLKVGDYVNLERALRVSDRLGGHIVQGHVDTLGEVYRIIKKGEHTEFIFQFPPKFSHLIVEKGSIAIDGISLTVNKIENNTISINVIPHTIETTNLKYRKTGDKINIEFDILGKYVNRILQKDKDSNILKLLEKF